MRTITISQSLSEQILKGPTKASMLQSRTTHQAHRNSLYGSIYIAVVTGLGQFARLPKLLEVLYGKVSLAWRVEVLPLARAFHGTCAFWATPFQNALVICTLASGWGKRLTIQLGRISGQYWRHGYWKSNTVSPETFG